MFNSSPYLPDPSVEEDDGKVEALVLVELLQDVVTSEEATEDEERVNDDATVQDQNINEVRV